MLQNLDNAYKHAKLLFYIVIRTSCFSDRFRLETLVKRRELAQELEGEVTSFLEDESRLQNMGVVYLDCRKLDSEQFSVFKGFLFEACQAVQKD